MDFKIKKDNGFEYLEVGKGPILLLLHGLFGALSNWKDVLHYYYKRYKVVIPLMPIYDMPITKTSVRGLSNFIHKFILHKNYPPVTLLGNSLGGHVALIYCLDHPGYVESMVLTGSSGLYENAMGGSFPKRNDYGYIKSKVEYTFYHPETASKSLIDEVYQIVNDRFKAIRIITMAKSAINHNLSKEIKNINIPVCLIWGKNDKITPPNVAEEFNNLIPNSELRFIDKCGHAPMMEHPKIFNRYLGAFLSKVLHRSNTQKV